VLVRSMRCISSQCKRSVGTSVTTCYCYATADISLTPEGQVAHHSQFRLKGKDAYVSLDIQWYLGIRPLWNKSNLIYVLFGREKFCLVYDLCLEYDSHASK
jgi:hypothetical protein